MKRSQEKSTMRPTRATQASPPQTSRKSITKTKATESPKMQAAEANVPPEPKFLKNVTPIWGEAEANDWIVVPRALIYIGLSTEPAAKQLKPRHILLALSIAAKKFKNQKTRRIWLYLAKDLNVAPDTVRKWAYELEKMGLLTIKRYKDRSSGIARSKPGYRNESNEFDLSPFVAFVERAYHERAKLRADRQSRSSKKAVKGRGHG